MTSPRPERKRTNVDRLANESWDAPDKQRTADGKTLTLSLPRPLSLSRCLSQKLKPLIGSAVSGVGITPRSAGTSATLASTEANAAFRVQG